MEIAPIVIDFLIKKFASEKKNMFRVLEPLSDEDIRWTPTPGSNSIANLAAHIWGTVHQRIETVFFDVPDVRDREKEFERGLQMSKEQALDLIAKSFDRIRRNDR